MSIVIRIGSLNLVSEHPYWILLLLRIPNRKRIWFWYETVPAANANYLRIRKQYKNSAYNQQLFHILFGLFQFLFVISVMVLNLKVKKNLVTTVQNKLLYETTLNLLGTTSILKTGAD